MIVRPPWSRALCLWHQRHRLAYRVWSERVYDTLDGHGPTPLPRRHWWEQRQGPL